MKLTTTNDDQYFVFEDYIYQVSLFVDPFTIYLSLGMWLLIHTRIKVTYGAQEMIYSNMYVDILIQDLLKLFTTGLSERAL